MRGLEQQELPDILKQVPRKDVSWPEEILEDLRVFVEATKAENGLIPNAACPTLFDVSTARWSQITREYTFKTWTLFGKKWYSRRQLEDFHKIDRQALGGWHKNTSSKMAKMLKESLSDAAKD